MGDSPLCKAMKELGFSLVKLPRKIRLLRLLERDGDALIELHDLPDISPDIGVCDLAPEELENISDLLAEKRSKRFGGEAAVTALENKLTSLGVMNPTIKAEASKVKSVEFYFTNVQRQAVLPGKVKACLHRVNFESWFIDDYLNTKLYLITAVLQSNGFAIATEVSSALDLDVFGSAGLHAESDAAGVYTFSNPQQWKVFAVQAHRAVLRKDNGHRMELKLIDAVPGEVKAIGPPVVGEVALPFEVEIRPKGD
jgi:hypothetical protein